MADLNKIEALPPCPICRRTLHWCDDDDDETHECHMVICDHCGDFDLYQGADPKGELTSLLEVKRRIVSLLSTSFKGH